MRFLVGGADGLTSITAENTLTKQRAKGDRDRSAMLNAQVRKASAGVDGAVRKDRFGGASHLAAVAIGAVGVCERLIRHERDVNQEFTQKKPRSVGLGGQTGIPGNPPQASLLRVVFFEDWSSVDANQVLEWLVSELGDFLRKELCRSFQDLVVIGQKGISGNAPLVLLGFLGVSRDRIGCGEADNRTASRQKFGGVIAGFNGVWSRHVVHVSVMPGFDPIQIGLIVRWGVCAAKAAKHKAET